MTGYFYAGGSTLNRVRQYAASDLSYVDQADSYGGSVFAIVACGSYLYAAGATTQKVYQYNAALAKVAESADYGGAIYVLATDGTYIYVAGATTQKVWKIDPSDMSKVGESASLGATIYGLACDGTYIYTASGTKAWKINCSDMSKAGETAALEDLTCAYFSGGVLYIGGVSKVWKITPSTMATAASAAYGGVVRTIISDGTYVFAGGQTSYKVRKFAISNLANLGDSASYGNIIWTSATDGTYIYIAGAGPNTIWRINPSDLSKLAESPSYGYAIRGFAYAELVAPPTPKSLSGTLYFDGTLAAHRGGDLLSTDSYAAYLYLFQGFSNVIRDSISGPSTGPTGIAWKGTDVLTVDSDADKYYQHQGFSEVILASFASPGSAPFGIEWDGSNALSTDSALQRLHKHVGFTSTVSGWYASPGIYPQGIGWDGSNALTTDGIARKHYKHTGMSATVSDSYASPDNSPRGIAQGSGGVVSSGGVADKHYRHVGFSGTIAECYSSPASSPYGMSWTGKYWRTIADALTGDFEPTGELTTRFIDYFSEVLTGRVTTHGTLQRASSTGGGGIDLTGRVRFWGRLYAVRAPVPDPPDGDEPGDPPYEPPPDEPPYEPPDDPDLPPIRPPYPIEFHKYNSGRVQFIGTLTIRPLQMRLAGSIEFRGRLGTSRVFQPPDDPGGITFHEILRGTISFIGDMAGIEHVWPIGTFDKGTVFDSLTLVDDAVSGSPQGRVLMSRHHPHRGKYYLAVHQPTKLFTAEVDSVTADVGGTEVTFVSSTGTYTDCLAGMTVKVYNSTSTYKGKTRLRALTDPTGTATLSVAEQDDLGWTAGDFFEVYDVFELWAKFPRVIVDPGDPEALIFYRDWDLTEAAEEYPMEYSADRCIPVIGPSACVFLDDATVPVYFSAQYSYNITSGRAPGWWSWAFQDGTPSTSSVETPGEVTWDAAGTYRVDCQVSVAAPTREPIMSHRYVHVFERTGENAPYTNFKVSGPNGSFSDGGWSAEFDVYGDVAISEFPEGAEVILFAEEMLGDYDFGSEFDPDERPTIKYVGYILAGSVVKDPETKVVSFKTSGIHTLMKNRDNFSLALDHVADAAADTWYKQSRLSANYAFVNLMMWNSTIMEIADVLLPAYYYALWSSVSHKSSEHLIQFQDFERGVLWQQIESMATDVFARVMVSSQGLVSIMNDPQYTLESDLDLDLPVPYTMAAQDWETPITITFSDEPTASIVSVEGIAFNGTVATPIIAYFPGELPTYRGSVEARTRCVLTSLDEGEFLAERLFATLNNPYPEVAMDCLGNYSFLELVDYAGVQIALGANDTRYGVAWTAQRMFLDSINQDISFETGVLTTHLRFIPYASLKSPQPSKVS